MKFLLIAFTLVGIAAAALPDSATQGPNPQDIATPEPEYIDIDLPEPPRSAPVQVQRSFPASGPVPRSFAAPALRQFVAPRPLSQPITASYSNSAVQYRQPQRASGHAYNNLNGYQYRRPVYVRRSYYHRLF